MKKNITAVLCLALICALFCACASERRISNTYVESERQTASATQDKASSGGGASELVGFWYAKSERDLEGREANRYIPRELEINSDGTGDTDFFEINYSSEAIVWTASNGTLTITSSAFENTYDYTIEGDMLILRIGDSYEGILYRK